MIISVILSIFIFLLYVIGVCITLKGIPQSISDTFYLLNARKKNLGYLFTLFCWGVAFSIAPALLDHADACPQIIRFLAVVGLLLVGAAPLFKGWDRTAHFVGAYTCILCSQIWAVSIDWKIPTVCWCAWLVGTAIYMITHRTGIFEKTAFESKTMFWIEIVAFVVTYSILLTHGG